MNVSGQDTIDLFYRDTAIMVIVLIKPDALQQNGYHFWNQRTKSNHFDRMFVPENNSAEK